jgi:hypothetical protein
MAYTQTELDRDQEMLVRLYFFFLMVWVGMIASAVIAVGG